MILNKLSIQNGKFKLEIEEGNLLLEEKINEKEIIEKDSSKTKFKKQIEELEVKIKKEKQFNLKVEMNQKLKELKKEYKELK